MIYPLKLFHEVAIQVAEQFQIESFQAELVVARASGALTWADLWRILLLKPNLHPPTFQACSSVYEVFSARYHSYTYISDARGCSRSMANSEVSDLIKSGKEALVSLGVDFTIFKPTDTGLMKSILDATIPMRLMFKGFDFHDFDSQQQGPDNKVTEQALFLRRDVSITDSFSFKTACENDIRLYRPNTKKGDPRMWFAGLKNFAKAWDHIAVTIIGGYPVLINLNDCDLALEHSITRKQVSKLLSIFNQETIASELLYRLSEIARKGLIKATTRGSTAVGMSVEAVLGIEPNSSKEPDYKGIELKSGRVGKHRANLFAQVADWKLSRLTSSKAILEQFGYQRGENFKLYCSLSCLKSNSQGLSFEYRESEDMLVEVHDDFGDVAVWPADLLKQRLLEKHRETFWIKAESVMKDGVEYFKLISVIHTKNPLPNQLLPLIRDGVITMDHLIKKRGSDGRISEKGPLFKINKKDLGLLFPAPVTYDL